MNGLNDVTIMGTLGADAEVKQLDGDKAVANMSIAINDSYIPKAGGDRVQTTEWVKVEAWNGLANFLGTYGKKGTGFIVKGKLKTDSYVKEVNGQEVTFYSTKVVADKILFTGTKANGAPEQNSAPAQNAAPAQNSAPAQNTAPTQEHVSKEEFSNTKVEDDLPF
jgi:single-strand DNA-binding protein